MSLSSENNVMVFPRLRVHGNMIEELYALPRAHIFMIRLDAGHASEFSCFMHATRRFIMVEGCIVIETTQGTVRLLQNDDHTIPVGQRHRIANIGKIECAILELRQGSYTSAKSHELV